MVMRLPLTVMLPICCGHRRVLLDGLQPFQKVPEILVDLDGVEVCALAGGPTRIVACPEF